MGELAVLERSRKDAVRPIPSGAVAPPVPAILVRCLESAWEQAVRQAQGVSQDGMAALEKEFRDRLLKLGAHMLGEALLCGAGTGYDRSWRSCAKCGGKARFLGYSNKTVTTLVQEVRLKRAYYHCKGCGQGEAPLDRTLSVEGTTFSPAVREAICLLDAEVPFERGSVLLERLSAVRMHADEGRRLAEGFGTELERRVIEEAENTWDLKKPVPREMSVAPERLYFSPDGTHVNIQKEDWKEAKVGTVFSTRIPGRGGEPEREHTRYVATMGNAEDLGKRMYVEGLKLGFDEEKTEAVVVADGAHWIWNWAEGSLPKNRVEIIDFYHAAEKLGDVRRAVFGEENVEGKGWAKRWRDKLYTGKLNECLRALRRLKPKTKEGRESVQRVIAYYVGNRERMRYKEFRRRGYFIGSGVTESSCKRLVGARLKQAGMRWTIPGAQAILQLRLAVLNDRWDYLWVR